MNTALSTVVEHQKEENRPSVSDVQNGDDFEVLENDIDSLN